MTLQLGYKYFKFGSLPQTLQPEQKLYRHGNYGIQHAANTDPDNFWDSNKQCWTNDPFCGLDVAPKRPWEDLKDPAKNLFKFRRAAEKNRFETASYGWRCI